MRAGIMQRMAVGAHVDTFPQLVELLGVELTRPDATVAQVVRFGESLLGADREEVAVLRSDEWSHVIKGARPAGLEFVTVWPRHVMQDAERLGVTAESARDWAFLAVVCARVREELTP